MVLVFTIVSAVQEKLTVMVEDSKRRKQEEIERKKRQLEEEEQVLSREGGKGGSIVYHVPRLICQVVWQFMSNFKISNVGKRPQMKKQKLHVWHVKFMSFFLYLSKNWKFELSQVHFIEWQVFRKLGVKRILGSVFVLKSLNATLTLIEIWKTNDQTRKLFKCSVLSSAVFNWSAM